jgi:hypothetical protein
MKKPEPLAAAVLQKIVIVGGGFAGVTWRTQWLEAHVRRVDQEKCETHYVWRDGTEDFIRAACSPPLVIETPSP